MAINLNLWGFAVSKEKIYSVYNYMAFSVAAEIAITKYL